MTHNIPSITLLCMEKKYISALESALPKYWRAYDSTSPKPKITLTVLHESLRTVPETTEFDLIVSPANSYGLLDGAFDDAISRSFCVRQKLPYETLTYAVQDVLYEKYRGFAPPGSCTLVRFPEKMLEKGHMNEWGCRWIAICPTMRLPTNVAWDREVVYECVWSLLCEVERHNRRQEADMYAGRRGEGKDRIDTVLMTPIATGVGRVSPERWAAQVVLALKHFVDAVEKPERWGRLTWMELGTDAMEVSNTY